MSDDQINILLVDDKPDKLFALEVVLGELGQNLVKATSGDDALRKLLRDDFAVILLDVNMPGMDGFETASLIRKRKSSEHTPIIFVTAISDTETHMSRGYSLGAVDYIFTPVVPEILRAKVTVFIDLFRKTRQVRQQAEQLRLQAELRAEGLEDRLERLLNRLDVGVFRATTSGSLIEANRAFHRLLGMPAEAATPSTRLELATLIIDQEESQRLLARMAGNGQVQGAPVQLRRVDGSPIWVSLTTTSSQDGGEGYVDGLVEDITERKLAEDALAAKAEELARSNANLEQFAYIASHDLQEPLRMISSYSSLLSARYKDKLDSRAHEYIDFAVEGAARMQNLVSDLLSFSRVSMRERSQSTVDCNEVLNRAMFNLQASIQDSGAVVTHDPLPMVAGDQVLLGQLFQNLLGNALKFRRGQPPSVHISATQNGDIWEFAFADNGIGIPAEYQDRIFGIFQRLHTRREYPGTGIGLAVCRKVVEHHGGRIWVDSRVGSGSTFRFTISAAAADAPLASSEQGSEQSSDHAPSASSAEA